MARHKGKGSFSSFYQCFDSHSSGRRWVGIKILKNDKDCVDTGIAEVRVLSLLKRQDPDGVQHLLRCVQKS